MSTVIRVENLSKLYRLGEVGTGSIAHDVNRWWHRVRGKEDPYLKIGQVNDRTKKAERREKKEEGRTENAEQPLIPSPLSVLPAQSAASDYVYALKDVSFDVKQGEVLGIIGRNGAGKSTLLKILSRVTVQTTGRIRVKGRIASLLEVGTGFHPELTGRENIFLNGAILGMRKAEIKSKFDEIVAFSGCERYVDTPVKRYSSGMYVRLAFAVAAHLEPEILIVDEVLAVGDAEFQKKCLGKMKDVAGHGRTVLFVSHNMTAVQTLCSRCLYLKNGEMAHQGPVDVVVSDYLKGSTAVSSKIEWSDPATAPKGGGITLKHLYVAANDKSQIIRVDSDILIDIVFHNESAGINLDCTLYVINEYGMLLFENEYLVSEHNDSCVGEYILNITIPKNMLNVGRYYISVIFGESQRHILLKADELVSFDIANVAKGQGANLTVSRGIIRPLVEWHCSTPENTLVRAAQ